MTEVRFTFDAYEALIRDLKREDYDFRCFEEDLGAGSVLLRHDVDWSPRKARRIGEIEARNGVSATYCFLVTSPFYNVANRETRDVIAALGDLGHDVGLHFSTHQYEFEWQTDGSLVRLVDSERRLLGDIADREVRVVSFHNPPQWVFKREFETFVSTYAPRFFEEIEYRADSNQRWRDEDPFVDGYPNRFQLLTHPVLWGA
ncbi:MAG: hypothetical protein RI568_15795, partial [Natronomonas sp.]|uniref:hypothetical protein n=1 Tax=Natronomonas sp. TaxID=2184060 RepID=UPI00287032D6